MPTEFGSLTDEERRNGWDEASLAAHLAQRRHEEDRIAGNVVTEFVRPRPPIVHESALSRNPHNWGR